jgi:hypothetical protein
MTSFVAFYLLKAGLPLVKRTAFCLAHLSHSNNLLTLYLFAMPSFQETIFNLLAKSLNKEMNIITISKMANQQPYDHMKARAACPHLSPKNKFFIP